MLANPSKCAPGFEVKIMRKTQAQSQIWGGKTKRKRRPYFLSCFYE